MAKSNDLRNVGEERVGGNGTERGSLADTGLCQMCVRERRSGSAGLRGSAGQLGFLSALRRTAQRRPKDVWDRV